MAAGNSAPDWRQHLDTDDFVDVKDEARGVWCEGVVLSVNKKSKTAKASKAAKPSETVKTVRVHFRGRPDRENKTLSADSPLLAPPFTHVPNWRKFKPGDRVQVGTAAHKQVKLLWRNAIVEKVRDVKTPDGVVVFKFKNVRVRMEDGEGRWLRTDSECLCPPRTHNVFISSAEERDDDDDDEEEEEEDDEEEEGIADDSAEMAEWRASVKRGTLLEVADPKSSVWYEARVVDRCGNKLYVRFRGWPWSYDECMSVRSDRIAPAGTHLGSWRAFKKGAAVKVGISTHECSDTTSHWVTGTVKRVRTLKGTGEVARIFVEYDAQNGDGLTSEWRDADDDFLAPFTAITYTSRQKSRATKEKPSGGETEPSAEPLGQDADRAQAPGDDAPTAAAGPQVQTVAEDVVAPSPAPSAIERIRSLLERHEPCRELLGAFVSLTDELTPPATRARKRKRA